MNFDNAKENIQPLACGRDAKRLEIAVNAEVNEEAQKELQRQKREYEENIQNYCGDDPLETWFEYITWVEQCFPKSGKECAIDELLKKCLLQFGDNSKYFQDSRFIKIYIKFIDTQENPVEIYQQLYNHGIGTMVADFYIGWAYYYDLTDNFNKANEIFIKGIDARAQPIEELELAQKTFGFSIPARLLNRDEDDKRKFMSTMEEKRNALTSLRAHKHKYVGSLRTGNVVKSAKSSKKLPTTSSQTLKPKDNRVINVFQDTSKKNDESVHYLNNQPDTSLTHSLIDKARDKENKKEPGPWSKSNKNQSQNVIKSSNGSLAFSIMEDSENKTNDKLGEQFAIKLPSNFKRSNVPQSEYNVPLFISEERAHSLPRYDKIMVYPGNGEEYSIEELRAWKYFKKFNIVNQFVLKYDTFWSNESLNLKVRIPPRFPKRNQNQNEFLTEPSPKGLPINQRINYCGWKNYDYSEDLTVEDFLAQKWCAKQLKNKTVIMNMSLDETAVCQADNSVVFIDESYLPPKEKKIETPIQSPAPKKMKVNLGQTTSSFPLTISTNLPCTEPQPTFEIFTDENVDAVQVKPITNVELPIKIKEEHEQQSKFERISTNLSCTEGKPKFEIFTDENVDSVQVKLIPNEELPILGKKTSSFAFKINEEHEQESKISTNFPCTESKPAFKIFADENIEAVQVKPTPNVGLPIFVDRIEEATVETNFKIFEDNMGDVFKEPKYTGAIKKCISRPQQIKETQIEGPLKDNEVAGFSTEETFSTQNFVLFINQHETSTPLRNKKRESNIPESNEQIQTKAMSSQSLSSPEYDTIPKLSVIMETSETNTGGTSGTNTKSSLEENESSKILLNCNQTAKSKTINNYQNLSTIHESSCPRDNTGKEISKLTTLGLSGLKLTDDSVTFPKANQTTKELYCPADELCDLFSKTPDKNIKVPNHLVESTTKSGDILSLPKNDYDDLFEFFKKSPKAHKKPFIPAATIVLNDSVTIPSFKDILMNNKCDTTTNVTNALMGASMAMPKDQSIMPEYTENMSIFAQHQKSKLISFTTPTATNTVKLNEEYSTTNQYDQFLEGDLGKSIYEPKQMIDDEENLDYMQESDNDLSFQHKLVDLNHTLSSNNIDPWNVDLCGAFLEGLGFFNYLEKRDDCILVNIAPSLKGRKKVEIAGKVFNSIEYVSKGAYGFIYRAKDETCDKMVVLKQERPPNCWEYYISIIITERIFIEFLPRFMVIDYALVGKNSSIFVSDYVQHGTLLDVCNKVYTGTSRHLDELIVMVLVIELFTIVDLLHSADIIHGDIKPDNFLLMANLSLDSSRPMLKLIDYGNSIDMQRFPIKTTFKSSVQTEDFICSEMKDGRPWTYQTDLYCLAGTIHVLLFGHYMKTENKLGKFNILTKFPRYFHKTVWDRIFTSLLNVPDCETFPNLQDFKLDLKEILAGKEKLVLEKVLSFNRSIK